MNGPIPIKVVLVGDNGTGKSSLAQTYSAGEFPDEQLNNLSPFTILDTKLTGIQGETCSVSLWDTASNEEMDRLRPLSYCQSDLFFLCFSIVQPESYESIRAKWAREIRFHARDTPIVLIGLMADLRSDETIKSRLAERQLAPIVTEQGQSLAKELNARCYVECSALTKNGLTEAVETGIAAVLPDIKSAIADALRKAMEEENRLKEAEESAARAAAGEASTDIQGVEMVSSLNNGQTESQNDKASPAERGGGGCCSVM